jgi:ubiquinone/menaquinone biosynthesis C-methylase UbiE
MFRPFEDRLVAAASEAAAQRVLDVGCGTGGTTLAIARKLGPTGRCTGIDVSQPMIDLARSRATREHNAASFIVADAQTHEFAAASFDMVVSRFGVMFFADPVQAFANLNRAASRDAALRCMVFRDAAENPFMTAAERAAAPLLPDLPRRAGGPGQFAFADARQVQGILETAGWRQVEIEPIDVTCVMPLGELDAYVTRLGPVGLALRHAAEPLRARVVGAVRAAFQPYVAGAEVRFTAACWELAARA